MEEFDLASSKNSNSSEEEDKANLWMCGASKASLRTDGTEWCRDVMSESYVPIPYAEEKFEPVEWLHCLATLDVSTVHHGTKFCDTDGYDVVPIRMVIILNDDQNQEQPLVHERHHQEEVSIEDLSVEDDADDEQCKDLGIGSGDDDFIVLESELEKVRMLLKGREDVHLQILNGKFRRKFCKGHQKFCKEEIREKKASKL